MIRGGGKMRAVAPTTIWKPATCSLPTPWGDFVLRGHADPRDSKEHAVLTLGCVGGTDPVLVRIHSECLTGDVFGSLRCDCGAQLQTALARIAQEGRGVLLYLRQEGRGIGLINKIRAYHLQDGGADTVEANHQLGFPADMRTYDVASQALHALGVRSVRLLSNNPAKRAAIEQFGIEVIEQIPLWVGANLHNASYLSTKAGKMGHLIA